jgi:hypothetical protein
MQIVGAGSKVDAASWGELEAPAAQTRQNVSGLLEEASREYAPANAGGRWS